MGGYRYRAIVDAVPASESLALLTDFEERLFWRLVSQTDDFGAFHAAPAKVRAECMPLLPVTDPMVMAGLEGIVRAGHAEIYMVGGRAYLRFVNFDDYQPASFIRGRDLKGRRRFPEPENPCTHREPGENVRDLQGRFSETPANERRAHEVEVEVEGEVEAEDLLSLPAVGERAREVPAVEPVEEPALMAQSPAESPAKRPRDELWDALATLLGEPATRSERGRRNRAVKELREIEASAEDVRRRADHYRQRWPGLAMTETALVANWTLLGGPEPESTNEKRPTGWRFVHGSHGGTYVRDPKGCDDIPRGYAGATP